MKLVILVRNLDMRTCFSANADDWLLVNYQDAQISVSEA
jgi:hypothetical protein